MASRVHRGRIRTESHMAEAVKNHLNKSHVLAESEVKLGRCRLDVVAYDKNARIFKVVECKLHNRLVSVGSIFGKATTYLSVLKRSAFDFIDVANNKFQSLCNR